MPRRVPFSIAVVTGSDAKLPYLTDLQNCFSRLESEISSVDLHICGASGAPLLLLLLLLLLNNTSTSLLLLPHRCASIFPARQRLN